MTFELRGTMCTGAEEKVAGLKLIQSPTESETLYAMASPALAPILLKALNNHDAMVKELEATRAVLDKYVYGKADKSHLKKARRSIDNTLAAALVEAGQ